MYRDNDMHWGVHGGSGGSTGLCDEDCPSQGFGVANHVYGGVGGDLASSGRAPALLGYLDVSHRPRHQFYFRRA